MDLLLLLEVLAVLLAVTILREVLFANKPWN